MTAVPAADTAVRAGRITGAFHPGVGVRVRGRLSTPAGEVSDSTSLLKRWAATWVTGELAACTDTLPDRPAYH